MDAWIQMDGWMMDGGFMDEWIEGQFMCMWLNKNGYIDEQMDGWMMDKRVDV